MPHEESQPQQKCTVIHLHQTAVYQPDCLQYRKNTIALPDTTNTDGAHKQGNHVT